MINLVRSETPTPLNCKDVTTGKGFNLLVGSHIDLLVNVGGGGSETEREGQRGAPKRRSKWTEK